MYEKESVRKRMREKKRDRERKRKEREGYKLILVSGRMSDLLLM